MQHVSDLRISAQSQARMGRKAVAQKNYQEAIRYFKNAVAANETRTDTRYNLAMAWFLSGQLQLAQEQLTAVLKLDAEHEKAIQLQNRIQKRLNAE